MRRQECGSNAMVTMQMTVEEYLEMKSRQDAKEVTSKQKNLVYGLEGIKTLFGMRNGGEPVWAWIIFAMVWISAIVGTCLSFRKMKSQSYLETTCYVLQGFPDGYSIKNADKTVLFADFWVILYRNERYVYGIR